MATMSGELPLLLQKAPWRWQGNHRLCNDSYAAKRQGCHYTTTRHRTRQAHSSDDCNQPSKQAQRRGKSRGAPVRPLGATSGKRVHWPTSRNHCRPTTTNAWSETLLDRCSRRWYYAGTWPGHCRSPAGRRDSRGGRGGWGTFKWCGRCSAAVMAESRSEKVDMMPNTRTERKRPLHRTVDRRHDGVPRALH